MFLTYARRQFPNEITRLKSVKVTCFLFFTSANILSEFEKEKLGLSSRLAYIALSFEEKNKRKLEFAIPLVNKWTIEQNTKCK